MGLVVMKTKPYIAVSPDLKVKCNCCGEGLVEIKCPYSIKETIPSVDNLDYLVEINDKVSLNKNSNYYFQIQGQMAVTETAYTDFFVFTTHGNLLERIERDPSFWADLLMKLEWFWINCLLQKFLPEKFKENIKTTNLMNTLILQAMPSHLIVLKLYRQHQCQYQCHLEIQRLLRKTWSRQNVQDRQNLQNTRRDKNTKKFTSVVPIRVNVLMNQRDPRNTV